MVQNLTPLPATVVSTPTEYLIRRFKQSRSIQFLKHLPLLFTVNFPSSPRRFNVRLSEEGENGVLTLSVEKRTTKQTNIVVRTNVYYLPRPLAQHRARACVHQTHKNARACNTALVVVWRRRKRLRGKKVPQLYSHTHTYISGDFVVSKITESIAPSAE